MNPEIVSYVRSLERSPDGFMQSQQDSVNTNVNDIDNEEQVSVSEETVSQEFNEGLFKEEQSS